MTDATPGMIAMARLIYANYGATKANEAGDVADTAWMDAVIAGDADKSHGVQIALAAIIETQRLDAELVDTFGDDATFHGPALGTRRKIATAIRAGKHYGKDEG